MNTGWLRTEDIHGSTILHLRSEDQQGWFLLRALRGICSMPLFWLPEKAGNSWYSFAHTYITPISVPTFTRHSPCVSLSSRGHLPTVSVSMSKFPLLIRTCCHVGLSHGGLRAHPTPVWPHLNLTNDLGNDPISEKDHILSYCGLGFQQIFWGDTI